MYFKKTGGLFLLALLSFSCHKDDPSATPPFNGKIYSNRPVGQSAHDLLSAQPFTSLKIEIQYMPGYAPEDAVVNQLKTFLSERLNKPGGISIIENPAPTIGKAPLSQEDVIAYESKHRSLYPDNKELTLYVLLADAPYTNKAVLGFAYTNTAVCLFGKTIHDHSGGIGQVNRSQLYVTVLEHEFGHLLGLVNIGSPMQTNHQDNAHPDHCNNKHCLMYYAAETTDILSMLATGPVPPLDDNCLNDLRANGGK